MNVTGNDCENGFDPPEDAAFELQLGGGHLGKKNAKKVPHKKLFKEDEGDFFSN